MTVVFSTGKDRAFVPRGPAGTVLTSNGPTLNPTYKAPLVQQVTFTLTAAQILAIGTTPVPILPAPGAGLAYQLVSVFAHYRFNTTAYTLGSMTRFVFLPPGGNPQLDVDAAAFLTQTADRFQLGNGVADAGLASSAAAAVNQPMNILGDGSPTLGDGTMTFTLLYVVLDVSVT